MRPLRRALPLLLAPCLLHAAQVPHEALLRGSLALQPCTVGGRGADGLPSARAFCTRFSVPEDWQNPAGRHIALHVAIVASEAAQPDADLVVFLDGGPGGAASADYPAIAAALAPLRERHEVLLIDQRGTGDSNPLDCPALQGSSEPGSSGTSLPAAPTGALEGRLHACLSQLAPRAAPQFYTTTQSAQDLEAVRQALGAPSLDVVAVSYGTRLAQQYARRYPAAVRSLVLDSPVPNRLTLLSEHARNLERALRLIFANCRAQPDCRERFGDSYAALYRVRDRLRDHPVPVQLRDPVSFQPLRLTLGAADLAAVVRFYSYSPLTAALLPLMVHEADQGNYAPLLGQKKWLADDLGDQITGGLELSVLCAEDADLLAPRAADADTLLGNVSVEQALAACAVWPRGARPVSFHTPLRSTVPALVIDGELDPVTPPEYGREIARDLTNARWLVAPGQGHGVMGVGCMPRLISRFVQILAASRLDAACLSQLHAVPAFVDYNGAGP